MKYVTLVLLSLFAVGCAPLHVHKPTPVNKVFDFPDTESRYYIQVGDVVRVSFQDFENLETSTAEELPVRPDGKVFLPLLEDEVAMAGLTPAQVRDTLLKEYGRYIKEPVVRVNIIQFAPRQVYVGGEVGDAQALPYRGKSMSVLDAVVSAGHFEDTAHRNNVIVIRYQGANSKPLVMSLKVKDAIKNVDISQNISLMPEDIIVVPRTRIAQANLFVDQYINSMIPSIANSFATLWAADAIFNENGD